MSFGARAFVFFVYALLGLSFIAGTATLLWEFGPNDGLLIATTDSHLFLFFPTLGVVALAAFYLPSCAFVDMYWRHVRFGVVRFILGLVLIAGASYWISTMLLASPYRSIWELSPQTLASDKGQPSNCAEGGKACDRVALLDGLRNLATVSHGRFGALKPLVRSCASDPLIEPLPVEQKRFCFASTPLTSKPRLASDAECCRAQDLYESSVATLHRDEANRSITGQVLATLLPAKVFFLLILFAISVLLALRHAGVARHYPDDVARIEVGVLVGAVAMMFFPLMSQGFVESMNALFGLRQDAGFRPIVPVMSILFGTWTLLIVLFFFRRHDANNDMAVKLAGVGLSGLAVVKYDLLTAAAVRFLGSGAGDLSIILLVSLSIISFIVLTSRHVRRAISSMQKE